MAQLPVKAAIIGRTKSP